MKLNKTYLLRLWTKKHFFDWKHFSTSAEGRASNLWRTLSVRFQECRLNRPSNAHQLRDRVAQHIPKSMHIKQPRIATDLPCFVVQHFAGAVVYSTETLIARNKVRLALRWKYDVACFVEYGSDVLELERSCCFDFRLQQRCVFLRRPR